MLKCLKSFNEAGIIAQPGDVFTGAADVESWLLDSWPGAWERHVVADEPVKAAAVEAPAVNKMVSAPAKTKGRR